MNKEKNVLYTAVAFIIIILVLASYIYITYNQTGEKTPAPNYEKWGSLEFPKDEGVHKSVYETYELSFNLSGEDGEQYYLMLQWNMNFDNNVLYHGASLIYTNPDNGEDRGGRLQQ